MKYAPNKVFILENGSYVEISYEELCRRTEKDKFYEDKLFLPLHGMLMEVAEDEYRTFYKNVRRQKYLKKLSTANGDFSYDMLTTDDFNGQDILVDEEQDVEEIVEKNLMLDKLNNCLSLLSAEEKELIQMIFFKELTEREIAKKQGISQVANLKFHKTEDGKVLIILDIFKGEETPYYYAADGVLEAYVRVGNESVKATPTELKRLVLRGKNTSYDSQNSTYKVEDYAFSQLRARYKKWTGNSFDEKDLVSFGLADEDGYLTNAGALLADDSPIRWSRLFCTRWNGLNKSGGVVDALDDAEYIGSVISLIENGEAFIKRNAKKMWKKTPNSREEMPEYVERSYHEALVNALAHRDYLVNGSEVHIDIYDDRMEIYSPGGMPDGSLIQERDPLTVPSTRRNPVLADVFNRLGYMERKGSGFGKIISGYEFQVNYSEDKKPTFRSDRYQFTVIMPNLNYGSVEEKEEVSSNIGVKNGVNDAKNGANDAKNGAKTENNKDKLIENIKENPQITQNELAIALGVSRRTVQRMVEELVKNNKIVRVGSRRTGYWEIVE